MESYENQMQRALTQKEILKELEKISEKMARGWLSQWSLKEIYQLILDMQKSENKGGN